MANTKKKPKRKPPKLTKHRSGRAVVRLHDRGAFKDYYCGDFGSAEAERRYKRIIREWERNGRRLPLPSDVNNGNAAAPRPAGALTIRTLTVEHATYLKEQRFAKADGSVSSSYAAHVAALNRLRDAYRNEPADALTVSQLEQVRKQMVDDGLARSTANKYTGYIIRMFEWAERREMIREGVARRLSAIEPLKAGQTTAREAMQVEAVDDETLELTAEHMAPVVGDVCYFIRRTGCRPSEALNARWSWIDTTDPDVWVLQIREHKTAHRTGKDGKPVVQSYPIGPKARAILEGRRDPMSLADGLVFPLVELLSHRRDEKRNARKCDPACSKSRDERRAEAEIEAAKGKPILHDRLRREIHRSCKLAGVEKWGAYQLRHARGSEAAIEGGVDHARIVLGHRDMRSVANYIESARKEIAKTIAQKTG